MRKSSRLLFAKGILSVIAVALCTPCAHAQATEPPWETAPACRARLKNDIKCFANHARVAMAVCAMEWKLAGMNGQPERAQACQSTSQEAMAPFYRAALRKMAKSKETTEALHDAYSYWLSAVRSLTPTARDSVRTYQLRNSEYMKGVEERLARLEIEQ